MFLLVVSSFTLIPSLIPQAVRPDELDIHTDEELEVMDWDDGDGWCRGKNKDGAEGYFPRSYVQPSSRSSSPPTIHQHGGSPDSGHIDNPSYSNGNGEYGSVDLTVVWLATVKLKHLRALE